MSHSGHVNVHVITWLEIKVSRPFYPQLHNLKRWKVKPAIITQFRRKCIGLSSNYQFNWDLIGHDSGGCDDRTPSSGTDVNEAANDFQNEDDQRSNDPFPDIGPVQNEQRVERNAQQMRPVENLHSTTKIDTHFSTIKKYLIIIKLNNVPEGIFFSRIFTLLSGIFPRIPSRVVGLKFTSKCPDLRTIRCEKTAMMASRASTAIPDGLAIPRNQPMPMSVSNM